MKIKMIESDIDIHNQRLCSSCPVASAVKRYFPFTPFINVQHYHVRIGDGVLAKLPEKVTDWILQFDRQIGPNHMSPIEFELDV